MRECFRSSDVVGFSFVPASGQRRHCYRGYVANVHYAYPRVARGSQKTALRCDRVANHEQPLHIEVGAKAGIGHPGPAQSLLNRGMVAQKAQWGIGCGMQLREIDNVS